MQANKDSLGTLGDCAEDTLRAARSLQSIAWRDIWLEKFHVTPELVFQEITKNVERQISRTDEEAKRREEYLAREDAADAESQRAVPIPGKRADKYGVDLDRFNELGKKPAYWTHAVRIAGCVHIDEMRTLMEIHYDEVYFEKYRAKGKTARKRPGE